MEDKQKTNIEFLIIFSLLILLICTAIYLTADDNEDKKEFCKNHSTIQITNYAYGETSVSITGYDCTK